MIRLRMTGGLGNQLFQFGTAAVFAQRHEVPVSIWAGSMKSYATPRDFGLDGVVDLAAAGSQIRQHPHWVEKTRMARLFPGSRRGTTWVSDANVLAAVTDEPVAGRTLQLDGYFIESIDQPFFDRMLKTLRPWLRPATRSVIPGHGTCAIHVRGGDFLKLGIGVEGAGQFYKSAVERFRAQGAIERLVVVTDDPAHATAVMSSAGLEVMLSDASLFEDFDLLRTADFAVLSNSTFSFWARALATDANRPGSTMMPPEWRPGTPRRLRLTCEEVLS